MIVMSDKRKAKKARPKAEPDGEKRRPRVMRLGEKVEALIHLRGFSAAEVSRKTGIHPSRISEWGRGEGEGSQSPLVELVRDMGPQVARRRLLQLDAADGRQPAPGTTTGRPPAPHDTRGSRETG
jgi:hypothetical protein